MELQDLVRPIFTGSYGERKHKPRDIDERSEANLRRPVPRPEAPQTNEDAQAVTDREARGKSARDRVLLENEERKERGPKVGHDVYYNEVQKRLASRLFLALGTEGKLNDLSKRAYLRKYLN